MSFPRRVNCDGTIDSICDRCFMTVATSTTESDLAPRESAHICEPARVAYYHKIDLIGKRPPAEDRDDRPAHEINAADNRR